MQQKVQACSEKLAVWGNEVTGNFNGRIQKCKERLKRFRGGRDAYSIMQFKEAKKQLTSVFNQREIFGGKDQNKYGYKLVRKTSNIFISLQVNVGGTTKS